MRKLILSGILIFTLILSFICVKTGTSIPKIYSYKDLKSQSNTTEEKLNELTRLKSTGYAATEANLQKAEKKYSDVKINYDKVSSTKTEEQKQKALLGQDYDLGYLWVVLGNIATKNNCDLTMEVSQEKDASEQEQYVLCDLKFKIVSGYDGITGFIEAIANDTNLGFIPENLNMHSEYQKVKMMDDETGTITEVEKLMLVTEFYKTDIPISKTSISKIENEQTVQEEKAKADEEAKKENTTNTSNSTANTTNKTNTSNTTNTSNK